MLGQRGRALMVTRHRKETQGDTGHYKSTNEEPQKQAWSATGLVAHRQLLRIRLLGLSNEVLPRAVP